MKILAFEDPENDGNSSSYHTGKKCIEKDNIDLFKNRILPKLFHCVGNHGQPPQSGVRDDNGDAFLLQ